jgi:hypothetical protein
VTTHFTASNQLISRSDFGSSSIQALVHTELEGRVAIQKNDSQMSPFRLSNG